MPQAGGELAIYRNDGLELCRWRYHPDFHFQLLHDTRGISLERINTSGEVRWHSAALPPGATPGLPNSQLIRAELAEAKTFSLDKLRFSPNADGIADDLGICWSDVAEGGLLNVNIYSVDGRRIRQLTQQQLMATTACLYWDGLDDGGRRCATGRYLIQVEAFWLDDRKMQQKLVVVLDALDDFNP